MFLGDSSFIDIVYGDSVFCLGLWVLFGILGQAIVGILILGRRELWAETCWCILRAQLPIAALLSMQHYNYSCSCHGDPCVQLSLRTTLTLDLSIYFLAYFAVMGTTIWLRFRAPLHSSPLRVASIVAPIVDVALTMGIFFVLFFR